MHSNALPRAYHSQAMRHVIACLNAGAHAGIVAYQDSVSSLLTDVFPASPLAESMQPDATLYRAITASPPYAPDATWRGLFASLLALAMDWPTCDLYAQAAKRQAASDLPKYADSSPNTGGTGRYSNAPGAFAAWVTTSVIHLAQELHALTPDTPPIDALNAWWTTHQARQLDAAAKREVTRKWHALAGRHLTSIPTKLEQRDVRMSNHRKRSDWQAAPKKWRHH